MVAAFPDAADGAMSLAVVVVAELEVVVGMTVLVCVTYMYSILVDVAEGILVGAADCPRGSGEITTACERMMLEGLLLSRRTR